MQKLRMDFLFKFKNNKTIHLMILSLLCVIVIAFSTGFPYDEASFLTQYFNFYIYGGHIFYYWAFGTYYYVFSISSFLLNIPFAYFGLDNVIIQELSIKLPFLISMGMTSFGVYFILIQESTEKAIARKVSLIFLLTPIVLYDAAFHGNGLIISLFFEVYSIVFLYKKKYVASAIFLGMAAASYLYPLFFIVPIMYFVFRRSSKSASLAYFSAFSIIFLIGQGLPIFFYFMYGIPLSQGSILGGIVGITSNGISPPTVKVISTWGPYFILQELTGYIISLRLAEIIFALSMIAPGIFFILIYKDPRIRNLLEVLFFESLIFIIFGLNSDPQYLTAIAPFSVLLFSMRKNYNHLSFLTILTIADIGAFITSSPGVLFSFYQDLNPTLGAYYLKAPQVLFNIFESLYIIILFVYLFYFLFENHPSKSMLAKINMGNKSISEITLQRKITTMASYLVIFALITLVLVAPGIQNPPSTIPSVNSLMQATYSSSPVKNATADNSLIHQYSITFGSTWSSLDNYAKNDAKYKLQIPPSPPKTADIGDFDQTSLISAQPNIPYSENFYFPFNSTFHGFFVIFGTNITPLVYLQVSNEQYANLTNNTYKIQTVDGTHNFFEVIYPETVSSGYHLIRIQLPQKNASLSDSHFNQSGASFRTLISNSNLHVNASEIPELIVNSSIMPNVTLSFYLSLSSTISTYFNGIPLGNYSTQFPTSIKIPGIDVRIYNTVTISGYYNHTGQITLLYNPPLSFSKVVLEENVVNIVTGIAFFIISAISLCYLINFVRRSV